jgi:hypothetical protein
VAGKTTKKAKKQVQKVKVQRAEISPRAALEDTKRTSKSKRKKEREGCKAFLSNKSENKTFAETGNK